MLAYSQSQFIIREETPIKMAPSGPRMIKKDSIHHSIRINSNEGSSEQTPLLPETARIMSA